MKPYGLVVCGGRSSRMGTDKSQLVYHGVPQFVYVADLLKSVCEEVFISCNAEQAATMDTEQEKRVDLPKFGNNGPIVALLTAFDNFPDKDLLVIGCDYPFLDLKELTLFFNYIKRDSAAAAFYNNEEKYEPLLAWYSKSSAPLLHAFFETGQYSLQRFLRQINAERYIPESKNSMISVDTPEDFRKAIGTLSFDKM